MRYAHLADDPVKAASEAIGSHIASAMASSNGGDVVDFKESRGARRKSRMRESEGNYG